MLEIKKITKTYRPKKGVPVQALKDVSLSFEDSGMVFVLGKSGSGKSTLLNLIGGLDFVDSGEIVIDGKSSRDFKQADYDSYRNTYIGFVFQEYNILNEFTVEENISLALELQSQKGEKQKVEEILKQVELEGYADRKPNELSGGQRQRVAIARAIVKNPKIIMADEPTGALDSETGKAIFETLKRLSKDRLVIVVSHDREFAEQYGDRIIELADGQVINDERKNTQDNNITDLHTANLQDTNTQQLKKSRLPYRRALTMGAKTLRRKKVRLAITIILCFLSFISFGLAITAVDYSRVDTEVDFLSDMYQDGIIVSPSLVHNELNKSTLSGASYSDLQKLREQTGLEFQGVAKHQEYYSTNYSYYNTTLFGDGKYYSADLDGFLPASQEFFDAQNYTLYGRLPENENEFVITKYIYEKMSISGLKLRENIGEDTIIYPEEISDIQSFLDKKLYLTSPLTKEPSLVVGVVDTNFNPDGKFDVFKEYFKIDTDNRKMYYLSKEFDNYFKYGYFKVGFVYSQAYQKWTESAKEQLNLDYIRETTGVLYLDGQNYKARFSGVASDEFIRNADKVLWIDGKGERRELANNEIILGADMAIDSLYPSYKASYNNSYKHPKAYFDGLVSIKDNISDYYMRNGGAGEVALLEEAESISLQELEIYKDYCKEINYVFSGMSYFSCDYKEDNRNIDTMQEKHWRWSYACYLETTEVINVVERVGGRYNNVTGRMSGEYIYKTLGDRWYLNYKLTTSSSSAKKIYPPKFEINYDDIYGRYLPTVEFVDEPVIVGVYFPKEGGSADFVINNKMYEETKHLQKSIYSYLIAPRIDNKTALKKLVKLECEISQARGFVVQNYGVESIMDWDSTLKVLLPIFWGVAGVLGLFSILLMGSYIATSITAQKKQIGMLRALGATKSDVFAIFANESAIIAGITLIMSVIGTLITCLIFNAVISNMHSIILNILHFGILQVVLIALVCIGVAVLASAIPLYKLSKKKPVDCIQDR